jgi:hypothetical protein
MCGLKGFKKALNKRNHSTSKVSHPEGQQEGAANRCCSQDSARVATIGYGQGQL